MAAPYINLSGPYTLPKPGSYTLNGAYGIFLSFTGDKIIVCAPYNSELFSYSLSIPFDLSSTITYSSRLSLTGIGSGYIKDIFFDETGLNAIGMYPSNKCHQYSLSTPFNINTMATVSANNALASGATSLCASQDGTRLYTFGTSTLKQYNLSTPWDISTAAVQITIVSPISSFVGTGMWLSPYETRLFILGSVDGVASILRYDLGQKKEIAGAVENIEFTPIGIASPYSLRFNYYENKVFISKGGTSYIYTYDGRTWEPLFWTNFKGQTEYLE